MTDDLKQEVRDLVDLVHDLIGKDEDGQPRPTQRVVLNLPTGWFLFATWLAMRERMRRCGRHGPSPFRVQELDQRTVRRIAKSYIGWVLNEHFHLELHDVATGGHPLLRMPSETGTKSKKGGAS